MLVVITPDDFVVSYQSVFVLFVWIHITGNCWLSLFQYYKQICAGCGFFFSSYKLQVLNNVQHLTLVFLLGVSADFYC